LSKVEIKLHRLAIKEVQAAEAWYAARSETATVKFRNALRFAIDDMADGRRVHAAERSYQYVRIKGFPYYIHFRRVAANLLFIVAVSHGRRRPGYWRQRERWS
jgi:plasmid stabilization system protein ParE